MDITLEKHKEALKRLHIGTITVYVNETKENEETGFEEDVETELYKNVACRISYKNDETSKLNDMTANANKIVDVFTDPDINILEGSRLVINWLGKTLELKNVGIAQYHYTHNKYTAEITKEHI